MKPGTHRPARVDAILFDLDGTLVDTREDIALSVNYTRARFQKPALGLEAVTRLIGDGARQLMMEALEERDEDVINRALDVFLPHYLEHCLDHARLYPGVREVLGLVSDKALAVVTNKLESHTRSMLKQLSLDGFFRVVLGGDSLPARKPSPEPLLEAAKRLGVDPGKTVIVGDSPGDIRAGKAAHMLTCAVSYGYRTVEELQSDGPDFMLNHLTELKEVIS